MSANRLINKAAVDARRSLIDINNTIINLKSHCASKQLSPDLIREQLSVIDRAVGQARMELEGIIEASAY